MTNKERGEQAYRKIDRKVMRNIKTAESQTNEQICYLTLCICAKLNCSVSGPNRKMVTLVTEEKGKDKQALIGASLL